MDMLNPAAFKAPRFVLFGVYALSSLTDSSDGLWSQSVEPEAAKIEIMAADGPSAEVRAAMERWYRSSVNELSGIRTTWTGLSVAIGQGSRVTVNQLCLRLHDDVARIRDLSVATVPDPIARLYLCRAIDRIDIATSDCSDGNLFAISYGLSEARRLFRRFDSRVAALGVEVISTEE